MKNIKDLIQNSELPQIQKNIAVGFILRAEDAQQEENEDRDLIEKVGSPKKLNRVIVSTPLLKIFTISGNEEWDKKYPYRSIYKKDGKWVRLDTVSPTLDTAFLAYLESYYLGGNSRFADFALKMLEIKIEE